MTTQFEKGFIVDTPKGKVKILERIPGKRLKDNKKIHPRAIIQVLETGTILNVQTSNLKEGKFNDYMKPTVYGVGFLGSNIVIPDRGKSHIIRRIYDLWSNMLKRCYGSYKTAYKDVTVDKRWHNFTTFLNTIQDVPCYILWEQNPNKYCLDKDIRFDGNRVYSRDTCTFVPIKVNMYEASTRRWRKRSELTLTQKIG